MKTFFIADNHFFHANILNFTDNETGKLIRPGFADKDEMNEYMISKWNEAVSPDDKIYHLGDFIMRDTLRYFEKIAPRLNGRKVLIKGNHDLAKLSTYAKFFDDVRSEVHKKTDEGDKVVFTHRPIRFTEFDSGFNVHGHIHQNVIDDYRYFNVGVELLNYTPIEWNVISDILMRRKENHSIQVWDKEKIFEELVGSK